MYTHRYTYIELYLIAEVVLQTAQLYWHLQTSIYLLNFSQLPMCGLLGFQLTWAEHAWAQLQTTDSRQTFFISLFSEQWAA